MISIFYKTINENRIQLLIHHIQIWPSSIFHLYQSMMQDDWNLSHKGWEQFLPELSDAQKVEGGWHLGDKALFRALMSLRQEEKRAQTKTSWISKSMMSLSVLFFFLSFILLLQYWYRDFFGHQIFWYRFATFFC